jgi:hypothetical protein
MYEFTESDSIATIEIGPNTLAFEPVYLDSANTPFIRRDGAWIPANELPGFRRYEKARRKKLFDTATLETVEV